MDIVRIEHLNWIDKKVDVVLGQKVGNVIRLSRKTIDMGDVRVTLCNLHAKVAEHDTANNQASAKA